MDRFVLICPEKHFYELMTLVREFFPLCTVISEKTEGVPGIVLSEDERRGTLYDETGKQVAHYEIEEPFGNYQGETSKNTAKVIILHLLAQGFSMESLPWGILTGVRPSKIAYAYLEQGMAVPDIVRVLMDHYHLRQDKAALCAKVAFAERRLMQDQQGTDVSVYVGIPFCPTRCAYCSFISSDHRAFQKYAGDYLETLIHEIREGGKILEGRRIRSFYMGGGTPTTLSAEQLKRLLDACEEAFHLSRLKEVTVEAGRPDTITMKKLEVLRDNYVTRISINPQTMVQKTLDLIGRRHTVEQIEEAFHMARELDHFIINMDLILGLQEEGIPEVSETLRRIEALRPDNLTVHTLAVKRSSRMNELGEGARMLREDPQALARMIDEMIGLSAASAAGMGLYPYYMYRQKNMAGNFENVGYARPGTEGLYNIEIMEERQSIAAFGAGGVSKVYTPKDNRIERVPNVKGVEEYIRRIDEMIARKKEGFGSYDG